jgi:hypothetical protein
VIQLTHFIFTGRIAPAKKDLAGGTCRGFLCGGSGGARLTVCQAGLRPPLQQFFAYEFISGKSRHKSL